MRKLVEITFGSTLYGTSTPTSDTDIKAVHIPNVNEILLGKSAKVISENTKSSESKEKNTSEDTDYESFALHHYFKLLLEGQPMAIEMLDAPDEFILYKDPFWDEIKSHREKFISKKSEAYLGYCRQQASKYGIKGSRVAAVRTLLEWLKEQEKTYTIQAKLLELPWSNVPLAEFIELVQIPLANGQLIWHISCCGRKVPFGTKLKEAISVYQKLFDEYGKRALQAENNEGVDWKALSHAVRGGRQAISVLNGEKLIFPIPYAQELLDIKLGKVDYKIVGEMIENLLDEVQYAADNSLLPEQPDVNFANQLLIDIYRKEVCKC